MQCHIIIPGQYACEEEGTMCPPCPCTVHCDHTCNLVCEKHHEWLEGAVSMAYIMWELWELKYPEEAAKMDEDERFDPENFSMMFEVLSHHVVMDNTWKNHSMAAMISQAKGEPATYLHFPDVEWPPQCPEEYRTHTYKTEGGQ